MRLTLITILLLLISESVYSDDVRQKRIVLSYDDAPMSGTRYYSGEARTAQLISSLREAKAGPVLFFVNTKGIEKLDKGMARLKSYAKSGHLLANHTHSHLYAHKASVSDFLEDIDKAEAHLSTLPNNRPWVRFPYLDEGRFPEKIAQLARGLASRGLSNGYVTVDTYDWYLNDLFQKALRDGKPINHDILRDLYVRLSLEAAEHYDKISLSTLGHSPIHVLLLHENDLAALYAKDLVLALRRAGWQIMHPDEAYKNPLPAPTTLHTSQGRLAALAIDKGMAPKKTAHWSIIQTAIDNEIETLGAFKK
ncbi:polysaccharide deacetylase family protein [Temperatibacter marinus]|uniref:Chitooligosaccharide deacetylase n=1 Tax=Temperatibacter marinus TaxID=1456591 RepID=A0AA52EC76_9PROT|nr:polysaccharide deacetylase family protein [Temperatibacter marinus]WND02717.1 polysaccharide deacetylase family protein [Temperatibacter marinus]